MLRKKQILSMVSIAIISFLTGTMFNVVTVATDSGGNPFDKIWEAIYDLQARVTSIEDSINVKTWHFVTSFNLSTDDEPFSPIFSVQGEKWRINWSRGSAVSFGGWYGFIIYSEDGYIIDTFDLKPVIVGWSHKGIYYVCSVPGNYYIELRNVGWDGISFTIESYTSPL